MKERKVYPIPKGLDDLPELLGIVPVDIAGVWLVVFFSLFFFNTAFAMIAAVIAAWIYARNKRGKPRNYIYLIAYRYALYKTRGMPSPVVKRFIG